MREFKTMLGMKNFSFQNAVDGQSLMKSGGRMRKTGATTYRLTFDTDSGSRITRHCAAGNGGKKGVSNVWSLMACTMSHESALRRLKASIGSKASDFGIVFEDDCTLRAEAEPTDALKAIAHAVTKLDGRFPGWQLLQIGAAPVKRYAPKTYNGACVVQNVHYAEHAYQAHCYLVKAEAIDSILEFLALGATADGALTRYQRRNIRKCFFCSPSIVCQKLDSPSDIAQVPGSSLPLACSPASSSCAAKKVQSARSGQKRLPSGKMDTGHAES